MPASVYIATIITNKDSKLTEKSRNSISGLMINDSMIYHSLQIYCWNLFKITFSLGTITAVYLLAETGKVNNTSIDTDKIYVLIVN